MSSRSRAWCFTINNYSPLDEQEVEILDCRYKIVGREVGDEGTEHLQGYVYFDTMKSFNQVKRMLSRAHIEKAKGTPEQNREYCSKDGNFTESGDLPMSQKERGAGEKRRWAEAIEACKAGRLDDVPDDIRFRYYRTCKEIKKDYMKKPDDSGDVTGVWFYGVAGVGKSRKARELYPNAYMKPCNKWWDGYQDEEYVVLDDIDINHRVLGHHLKIWGDRYAFIAETKGGAIMIRPSKIVVTSQYHPDEIWSDQETRDAISRRYDVVHLQ